MRSLAALFLLATLANGTARAAPDAPADPIADAVRTLVTGLGPHARPGFDGLPLPGSAGRRQEDWALPVLAHAPPDLVWEAAWLRAQLLRGRIETAAERAETIQAFEQAAALASGPDAERRRLAPLIAIAGLIWPSEPAAALARLDAIKTDLPEARAAMAQIRGRIALSAGRTDEALGLFGEAMALAARANDASMVPLLQELRDDVGLAHGLAGHADLATAYAGTAPGSALASGINLLKPACVPGIGLGPQTAVVLRLKASGRRHAASSVVWSRGAITPAALAQLQAAADAMTWDDGDTQADEGVRVQLGCASGGTLLFALDSKARTLPRVKAVQDWLASLGVAEPDRLLPGFGSRDPAADARARLDALAAKPDDPAQLLPLLVLASTSQFSERDALFDKAQALIEARKAPADVQAALILWRWSGAENDQLPFAAEAYATAMDRITDPASPAWLALANGRLDALLTLVQGNDATPDHAKALAALAARLLALAPAQLPAGDDLRRQANLALAVLAERDQRNAAAMALRGRAGLVADLCRLADTQPAVRGFSISTDDYPVAARMAGLEGQIQLERSVDASGATTGARTIAARPPQVFDTPSLAAASRAAQEPARRAGKPFACITNPSPIRWKLED